MKQVTPETTQEYMTQLKRFNMGAPGESDCPVFDGMYEYFAVSHTPSNGAVSSAPATSCCGWVGRGWAAAALQRGPQAEAAERQC